jgi:two-component system cell cycle sensor histidine kinase/response regulator CckA
MGDVLIPKGADTLPPPSPKGESETVLLLEDDAPVRKVTGRMLSSLGYQVLEAELPSAALAIASEHPGKISALLTDVTLPEMNGVEVAEHFRKLRPSAGVLFVSGLNSDAIQAGTGDLAPTYLGKPFSKQDLAEKLSQVIEDARRV